MRLPTLRRAAPTGTVLYDVPGPRAKLITYVVSAVAASFA